MRICKGSTRIVLIIGPWAVKIAIINPIKALKIAWQDIKHGKPTKIIKASYQHWCSVNHYLFRGIIANLLERRFYRRTKNTFLVPTWFSFFGLINIQPAGKSPNFKNTHFIMNYIGDISGRPRIFFENNHTLGLADNFCIIGGRLQICDYGDKSFQSFLEEWGERIAAGFDSACEKKLNEDQLSS